MISDEDALSQLQKSIEAFKVSDHQIELITEHFKQELEASLRHGDKKMLKCLPTFVEVPPSGEERGEYLLVDLGGTNLRVGKCKLLGGHTFELDKKTLVVPEAIKEGSGLNLFDYIAKKVLAFYTEDTPIKLGFTFSFPVVQESLTEGQIVQFNKGYGCSDVVGMDAVSLLQSALDRKQKGLITVASLVNDTVGAMVAHAYLRPATRLAVILGTGTNAAFWDEYKGNRMIINIEWGGYGDGPAGSSPLPINTVDEALDASSENPGKQTLEKMVSGMYLGELFRLASKHWLKEGYEKPYSLGTELLSEVSKLLASGDIALIQNLADTIMTRSARLASALITAVHQYSSPKHPYDNPICAIDGSLFTKNESYSTQLQKFVRSLVGSDDLLIEASSGEPLIGSAIVIATPD